MYEVWVDAPDRVPNGPFRALVDDRDADRVRPLFRYDEAARVVVANGGWLCAITCKFCSPERGNDAPVGKGPAWTWRWVVRSAQEGGKKEVMWKVGWDEHEPWDWRIVEGPRAFREGAR